MEHALERRPIIHVGLHKTATSWFQTTFYPQIRGYRYLQRRLVRWTLLARSPLAFDPIRARELLGLDHGDPAIICEEDLSGVLDNAGLASSYVAKELANQLAAIAPEARIVLFVRSQAALIASAYHQYLREGGTGSVQRYLFPDDHLQLGAIRPPKPPGFDLSQFEFDRLVAHYDDLFGAENVFVFAYEEFAANPAAFVERFCQKLGLQRPSVLDKRKYNSGFRVGLLPIARMMNLFTCRAVANKTTLVHIPFWYRLRGKLLELLNRAELFGRRPSPERLLGRDTVAWIQQRFWEGNRELARRMQTDLAKLGYATDPSPQLQLRPKRSVFLRLRRL
jgi:hypothetical protein